MKYPAYDGGWVTPARKGYKFRCCDCDLVHVIDFRIVKDQCGRQRIQFRVDRDERATAACRAHRLKRADADEVAVVIIRKKGRKK